MVITKRNMRKATFNDWTMNCPEKSDTAGRIQYTSRKIEVKGYIPALKRSLRWPLQLWMRRVVHEALRGSLLAYPDELQTSLEAASPDTLLLELMLQEWPNCQTSSAEEMRIQCHYLLLLHHYSQLRQPGQSSSPWLLLMSIIGIRSPPYRIWKRIDSDLELIILPLHSPSLPDKIMPYFVLEKVSRLAEIGFWVPWFNLMLSAKGNPNFRKACSFCKCLESEEGAAIVGEVAGKLLNRVIDGEDGEHRSAVETKTSMPGRSDLPLGLRRLGDSNLSLRTVRSVALFTGQSLGSWSRSHEKANQSSHVMDMAQSQIASWFGWRIRHARKKPSATRRIRISNLK
ncbi:hypothetical protein M5K25_013828 [Dendrobium thyrsiflorum]|uniref:Uncharacterized protein n=1 Tax=Dendrobium thyrsiflorum TaxID=117978 RepID=A0ABD0V0W6_DENTH